MMKGSFLLPQPGAFDNCDYSYLSVKRGIYLDMLGSKTCDVHMGSRVVLRGDCKYDLWKKFRD